MKTRITVRWQALGERLWPIPLLFACLGIGLAIGTIQLDQALDLNARGEFAWVFGGASEGARGVLTAIATSIMTVTGVVFSITIVTLQLASTQFTPRILGAFTGDRGNQIVLGLLLGTFTYALMVLRSVRSSFDDFARFVPAVSVSVAIALALASIVALIYFIDHIAHSIQASTVIERSTKEARGLIDHLFPDDVGHPDREHWPAAPAAPPALVTEADGGYLQAIDAEALFSLAEKHDLLIRVEPLIGDFVLPGGRVASVWPDEACDQEATDAIHRAVVLGARRTMQADVELAFRQLADIAVKALSPGINDPTTATIAIDHLAELVVRFARREKPSTIRRSADGRVRLIVRRPSIDRLLDVAFTQIRHFGAADVVVVDHLLATLERVHDAVPSRHRPVIRRHAGAVLAAGQAAEGFAVDRARLTGAAGWLVARPPSAEDGSGGAAELGTRAIHSS